MVNGTLFFVDYAQTRDEDDRCDVLCLILTEWCERHEIDPMDCEVRYWATEDGPLLDEEAALRVQNLYMEVEWQD